MDGGREGGMGALGEKDEDLGSRANSSIGSRCDAQANEKVTIVLEISEWGSAMLL